MNNKETVTVTDQHLIHIINALENLDGVWRARLKQGTLKLDYAVKLGSQLTLNQQQHLYDLIEDNPSAKKYEHKLLIAYSQDMPDWAVLHILRIYILADKVKNAIVMLNDLMDEYEQIMMEDFEFNFMEGHLAKEGEGLENSLITYEKQLQSLRDKSMGREKSYNQSYGDSSSSSGIKSASTPREAQHLRELLGLKEESTQEEMKKKYRHLLKVLHPDKGGSAYLFDLVRKSYEDQD
ncbi:MAG TPA: J domain-containing protein [Bacilli bacterium]